MKAKILPNGLVSIECDRKEADMLVTALYTHRDGNRGAVSVMGLDKRVADSLRRDADLAEALASKLEDAL